MKRTPLKRKTPLKSGGWIKKKKARHAPTSIEREYFAKVASIPCVIGNHECGGRTTVSHRPGAGMGLKAPHNQVASLCEKHHLNGPCSIENMGSKAWQAKYGPHEYWEAVTAERVKSFDEF